MAYTPIHTKTDADTLQNNLQVLQGYYRFLYIGKFLEKVIQHNDLSTHAQDIPIITGENTNFILKGQTIQTLLHDIYTHKNKKNLFGYLLEISAWKGIFSTMRELLDTDNTFHTFVHTTLKDQYFPFEQIIRFIRNVLTHTSTTTITIKKEDFINQKVFLLSKNIHTIAFHFTYAQYISQRKGSKEYGLRIHISFKNLRQNSGLFSIIKPHDLYLLSELCFNLSELFKETIKNTKRKQQ